MAAVRTMRTACDAQMTWIAPRRPKNGRSRRHSEHMADDGEREQDESGGPEGGAKQDTRAQRQHQEASL